MPTARLAGCWLLAAGCWLLAAVGSANSANTMMLLAAAGCVAAWLRGCVAAAAAAAGCVAAGCWLLLATRWPEGWGGRALAKGQR
tara:strand:- start:217 stop:471 length:255 start_codon:yes stop_codon:yes gene_type:complete